MSLPPCLMRLKVINSHNHINLWIPLFLGWMGLAILAIAISPIVLILVLILWPFGWGKPLLKMGPALYGLGCNVRGLSVNIEKSDEIVQIYFK